MEKMMFRLSEFSESNDTVEDFEKRTAVGTKHVFHEDNKTYTILKAGKVTLIDDTIKRHVWIKK